MRRRSVIRLRLVAIILSLFAGLAPALAQDFSSVPGVVIDHSPSSSGIYVGSAGITILDDGSYLAKRDEFGPNSTEHTSAVTHVFRSTDQGATWQPAATIDGLFWSNIFSHNGAAYMIGTTFHHGLAVIMRSDDGGLTWTDPVDASSGLLTPTGQYHTAPMPMLIHDGRIWRALEDAAGGTTWGVRYRPMVMSAPLEADLLDRDSWTFSTYQQGSTSWLGGQWGGWLEGNALVIREGQVVDILRTDTYAGGTASIVHVSHDGTTTSFDPATDFIQFPGGAKKFTIRYDAQSDLYWSLTNLVLPDYDSYDAAGIRNTAALVSSPDLINWEIERIVLHHPDRSKHAFQYPDWVVDGDDMIAAIRTAYDDGLGGANSAHNANLLTFHRFEDFRDAAPQHVLVTDTNNNRVMRYEVTDTDFWAPVGRFDLGGTYAGAAIIKPLGLAQDAAGNVFVGEQIDGGRVLRFDAAGNFLDVVAQEGVDFTGRPEALQLGPDGKLYMSVAFGDSGSDRIYRIDTDSGDVSLFVDSTFTGGSLDDPRGLAFAPDGNLYIVDRNHDLVRRFDGDTGQYLGDLFAVSRPQGLLWDQDNNRFIVTNDRTNTDVWQVLTNGASTNLYNTNDVGAALGILMFDGELYWSDYQNGRIYKLTGTNQKVNSVTGLNGPGHLLSVMQPDSEQRTWIASGSALWADLDHWYYWGRADRPGEVAFFGSAATSAATVTLNTNIALKGLRFRNANAYTIAGSGHINLQSDTGPSLLDVQLGQHQIQLDLTLQNAADITAAAGTSLTFTGQVDLNGQRLSFAGPGQIHITGSLLINDGELAFQLDDATGTPLTVATALALEGSLDLSLASGFTPDYGDSFTLLTAADITGQFAAISGVMVNGNLALAVTYDSTAVTVTAALAGDATLDGLVNLADLQILGDNWAADGASWASADFNGDGMVNLGDLQILGDHWNAAAGDFAQLSANIPEPHCVVLLGVLLAGGMTRHGRRSTGVL
ncbi:MAG: hypothetical protein IT445_16410 [Phycisphaeraceae bacterium]|nr:hypothetical protein [Phycisphaeraceae bacterium]